jgi:hypothetical protein
MTSPLEVGSASYRVNSSPRDRASPRAHGLRGHPRAATAVAPKGPSWPPLCAAAIGCAPVGTKGRYPIEQKGSEEASEERKAILGAFFALTSKSPYKDVARKSLYDLAGLLRSSC